jgi:hypothetical protein
MKCNSIAFQFVNNCELMKTAFNQNCRCYNLIAPEKSNLPNYDPHMNRCKTFSNWKSECESKIWGDQRICPCTYADITMTGNPVNVTVRSKIEKKYTVTLKSLDYMLAGKHPKTDVEVKLLDLKRKVIAAILEKTSSRIGPSTKSDLEKKIILWKSQLKELTKVD